MIKSRGFTDKLYFLNLTLSWIFILVCVILQIYAIQHEAMTLDIAVYGIPAVFAELSIHTGFVVWKAKHENMSKFNSIDWYDDVDKEEDDDNLYSDS